MSCYNYGILRALGVADRRRRVDYYREPEQGSSSDIQLTATTSSALTTNNINQGDSTQYNNINSNSRSVVSPELPNVETANTSLSSNSCDHGISAVHDWCTLNSTTNSLVNQDGAPAIITTTSDNVSFRRQPTVTNTMDDTMRMEEKLSQFKNDCKKEDSDQTTRSTFSSTLSDLDKQRRRNLIFDEERFEETFLKCLICREMYNEVDKLPKMLHCHHTFCMDCLYQMYRVEGEFRQSLTGVFRGMPLTVKIGCPTCREGVLISEAELRRLPNDHTIMELLCFVSQTGRSDIQYCTKHQMQPLNFFCEPCIMPVCCDCTVIDHKESKGHLVVNVDEAMNKYTPIVEETLQDINSEKDSLAEKKVALECALDELDMIQRNTNSQIRDVFDRIREILNEREKELYDVSESEIEKKRDIVHGHLKVLTDRESQLNSEYSELQKAKDDKDISLVFTGHKSARDVLSQPVHISTNSTKGFSVNFHYSSRADSIIKQQVANLGDIIFQS